MKRFRPTADQYPPGSFVRAQLEAAERRARVASPHERPPPEPPPPPGPGDVRGREPVASGLPRVNGGEELFALQLRAHGLAFEREYVFHPVRRWRLDFALLEHRIAIEIEGAIWQAGGGGHSHPSGIEEDIAKSNALTLTGWRLLRFMPDKHVRSGRGIAMLVDLLEREP